MVLFSRFYGIIEISLKFLFSLLEARVGSMLNLGYEPVLFRDYLNYATTISNSLKEKDDLVKVRII
jgi:hypothetical protein